jgi:hypothetical protein
LTNTEGNVTGTFTVSRDINTGVRNTVTISTPLAVGDIIEIEVNKFTLLQIVGANAPSIVSANANSPSEVTSAPV